METLSESANFLSIDAEYSNYEDSQIVVLQVPYEHTVSYGVGTKNAPAAIIDASAYVEFYDDEYDKELCFDKKIATLSVLDLSDCYDDDMLRHVRYFIDKLLTDKKFVVTLGGEHTISIAPISAYFMRYPEMSVLHFDAHSDLRDEYQGSKYSHACFMARVAEFFPTEHITQVGIRAQCKEEADYIRKNKINTFYASAIRRGLYDDWQAKVIDTLQQEVYITFDVDFFDPSVMPTTGTPEPDGFWYFEVLELFRKLRASGRKIIGFDVVELAPEPNVHHTDILVARLVYKMLNYAFY